MVQNPENPEKKWESLDGKTPDQVFDFSTSSNRSPDISKEQKGMKVIQKELEGLSVMWWKDGKMNPESIDHAFHAYTGKELDKVPNGPQKDQFESQRKELLTELQSIKDPREKLQAIASLKAEVDAFSGTASGAAAIWAERQKDAKQSESTNFAEKMKQFGEALEKAKVKAVEWVRLGYAKANSAAQLWEKEHRVAKNEAEKWLGMLT